MVEDLKEKLNKLPNEPGVYVMLDELGEIIYIGKARVLKNRVRQYFHSPKNLTSKVIAMVNKINDFYYYITKTEADALVLESNLIKKHKPQYNILLKDDKNYPYIKINRKEKYPKAEITRRIKKDGCSYFGPYMGGISVKDLMNVISEGFLLRTCNINFDKIPKNHRPCLNKQIGKCTAPCVDVKARENYGEQINEVIKFLKGDVENIKKTLEEKMQNASENERFERAIELRDMIKIIDKIKERKLTALPKNVDIDIFTFATDGINRVINHIIYRQGRMQGGENYPLNDCVSSESEVLSSFILQYYSSGSLPDEVVTEMDEESGASLNEALCEISDKRFNFILPKIGVRRGLIEMSLQNANEYLDKNIDKMKFQQDMTVGSAELLGEYLNLPYIKRMECFDISNISGVDKVASMVVFINGEKQTKLYRRFKIRTVEGANDYASMQEVLQRRLIKLIEGSEDESFSQKPDLIVVDGGKGQLSVAVEVRNTLGFTIPMIGLAEKNEEIYKEGESEPLVLSKRDNALKMLIRMRDETHRFAITYFRSLHSKNSLSSKLDGISGIGKTKKQALFEKFKTVSAIKSASIDDLMQVDGIGKMLATQIEEYFKN